MESLDCVMIDYVCVQKMVESAIVNPDVKKVIDSIDTILKKNGNYNQAGENNNNYKNGISTYTQDKKKRCEKCGGTKNLMVHHKDGNRKNNKPSNRQTLCWSCHEKITQRK